MVREKVTVTTEIDGLDLTDYRGNHTIKAIYRLEGDTLTLCRPLNAASMERPTRFESGATSLLELHASRV